MRRTTTLAALLLGTTLLAPTGLANAAGETCRGEAATIVGTAYNLQGTEGRDVIVTGTSGNVVAGGGDDLICATGAGSNGNTLTIDAGAGNDVVDSTALEHGYYLHAILGDGADTFVGGPEDERVTAGAAPPRPADPDLSEADRDVINTGAGSDGVTSGGPGLPNPDVVDTGSDADTVVWSGTMTGGGVLDAGDGSDTLITPASGGTFRIDLGAETLTRDGMPEARFSSIESLRARPGPDLRSLEIIGTPAADYVEVDGLAEVHTDLGGGDDSLRLDGVRSGSHNDLGAGTDSLSVSSGSVELDLAAGRMVWSDTETSVVAGVENAYVVAVYSVLTGDARANRLTAIGCLVTVDGGGGRDDVSHGNYDADAEQGLDCDRSRVTLRGGPGNDQLKGSVRADRIYGGAGNDDIFTGPAREGLNKAWGGQGKDVLTGGGDRDVLLGGAGRDRVDGGPDRDRCKAEVEKACER